MRRVRDLMSTCVWSVSAHTPLDEVAALLDERQVTGVPVVGPAGAVVGILSRTDLVERQGQDFSLVAAADAMTTPALSIRPDATVEDAARLMAFAEVHRVVVLDDGGRLAGIITTMDVLRELAGFPRRPDRVHAVAPPPEGPRH